MMKRSTLPFALFVLASLFPFACDEDPGAPEPLDKECILGATELTFGTLCLGDSTDRSFNVIAPATNDEAVAGEVSGSCDEFTIVTGQGPFTLSPGESWPVTVRYKPTSVLPDTCLIQTGAECGDVLCVGVANGCAQFAVEPDPLDFGDVCIGVSVVDTITLTADPGNTKQVGGTVSALCDDYAILSGSGAFDLGPGETRDIVVQFTPTTAETLRCAIDLGATCGTADCVGAGINQAAYFSIRPASATTFTWESNFLVDPPVVELVGVTFEDPAWSDCVGGGTWRMDGNQTTESGFTLRDFPVPDGATSVEARFDLDCEDLCVVLVWAYDTAAHQTTNPSLGCWHKMWGNPISPGVKDISFRTKSGATACEYDAVMRGWFGGMIQLTFSGPCAVLDRAHRGTGRIVRPTDQ